MLCIVTPAALSAFPPSIAVTIVPFVGYFLVANGISWGISGVMMVQSPLWIPTIVLLTPAVSVVDPVVFNLALVLILTAVMAAIAHLLAHNVGRRFQRERIISTL